MNLSVVQEELPFQSFVLKAVIVYGRIGENLANQDHMFREAKKRACRIFRDRPDPENITIVDWVFRPVIKAYVVVVTDGSVRGRYRNGNVNKH